MPSSHALSPTLYSLQDKQMFTNYEKYQKNGQEKKTLNCNEKKKKNL